MDNRQILAELDKVVFGHEEAKKTLITLVRRSKNRYTQKWGGLVDDCDLPTIVNCLLVGQSGTGKTHLVESLSKIMDFPFMSVDATELSHTSSSGGIAVDGLIKRIQKYADELKSVSREKQDGRYFTVDGVLDQMIIFVDEIDKLGNRAGSGWNQGTQATFLRFFENKTELTGLSFVFAGAFSEAEGITTTKKTSHIGFNKAAKECEKAKEDGLDAAIVSSGIMPELLGRMGNVVRLDTLTLDHYNTILNKIIIPNKVRELKNSGVTAGVKAILKLETKDAAQKALDSGLGVRYLNKVVNKAALDLEFYASPLKIQIKIAPTQKDINYDM